MHQETEIGNPVKFMRLNTGEDIVTEVIFVREEGNFYLCINPLKIVYNLNSGKSDSLIVAFSPWIFSSVCDKQEFPIFPGDVITIADPSNEIVECYKEFVERMEDMKTEMMERKSSKTNEVDITKEEEEYLKSVIDSLEKGKRKLH